MIGCRIGKKTWGNSTPEAFHPAKAAPPPCGPTGTSAMPAASYVSTLASVAQSGLALKASVVVEVDVLAA